MNSRFNIISFGNSYFPLFNSFMESSDTNVIKVINIIETFYTDIGGSQSEIALEYLSHQIPLSSNILTRAVFITDGLIGYIDKVLKQILQCMKGNIFRFDCLGIGKACSNDDLRKISGKENDETVFCQDNKILLKKLCIRKIIKLLY